MSESNLVFKGENNQALTNSLLVAKKFGKEHKHVLDAIRKLMTTAGNSAVLSMFCDTTYYNEQNKEPPMFIMNRDGFTLLAMGFTGEKALKFKIEYISAFNKMEETIKSGVFQVPQTFSDALLLAAKQQKMIEEQQKEISQNAEEIKALSDTVATMKPKADY